MIEDACVIDDPSPWAAEAWWEARRFRYNVGLLVAGPVAFVAYAAVVDWCISIKAPGEFEITIFTTLFQAVGYLVAMVIANVCYFLGAYSEQIMRPKNVGRYRLRTFGLGFWFSVLLPFIVPVLLACSCKIHAGQERRLMLENRGRAIPPYEIHSVRISQ